MDAATELSSSSDADGVHEGDLYQSHVDETLEFDDSDVGADPHIGYHMWHPWLATEEAMEAELAMENEPSSDEGDDTSHDSAGSGLGGVEEDDVVSDTAAEGASPSAAGSAGTHEGSYVLSGYVGLPPTNEAESLASNNGSALNYINKGHLPLYQNAQMTGMQYAFLYAEQIQEGRIKNNQSDRLLRINKQVVLPQPNNAAPSKYILEKMLGVHDAGQYEHHTCGCGKTNFEDAAKNDWDLHADDECPLCNGPRFTRDVHGKLAPTKVKFETLPPKLRPYTLHSSFAVVLCSLCSPLLACAAHACQTWLPSPIILWPHFLPAPVTTCTPPNCCTVVFPAAVLLLWGQRHHPGAHVHKHLVDRNAGQATKCQ